MTERRDKTWLYIGLLLVTQVLMGYQLYVYGQRISRLEQMISRRTSPPIELPAQLVIDLDRNFAQSARP